MAYKCSFEKKIDRVIGAIAILAALFTSVLALQAYPSVFIISSVLAAVGMLGLGILSVKSEPSVDCLID